MKESQTENDITIRWDMGLNQKRLAWFCMPKLESGEVRLAVGDELKLKFAGTTNSVGIKGLQAFNKGGWGSSGDAVWEGVGSVVKIPNSKCAVALALVGSLMWQFRCIGRNLLGASKERRSAF